MSASGPAKLHHKPHIAMLREDNVRVGFFEREQCEAVLAHLPEAMRPAVTFAYVTGWRINSEALPLQWRQVDLGVGEVRLDPGSTKNREGRVLYLAQELQQLLKQQRASADEIQRQRKMIVPHVFFHRPIIKAGTFGHLAGQHISPHCFYQAWRRARTAAGCPGSIPHDLRRTAIRNTVRAGIPERVAMKMSGHKTRSVFDRYNVVSDGDLRSAARRLGTLALPQPLLATLFREIISNFDTVRWLSGRKRRFAKLTVVAISTSRITPNFTVSRRKP